MPNPSFGNITSASGSFGTGTGSSGSGTHDNNATGLIIPSTSYSATAGDTPLSALDYNGVSADLEVSTISGANDRSEIYSIPNASTGSNTLSWTYTGACEHCISVLSIADNDTTNIVRNTNSATGNSSTPSVAVSSVSGDLCIDNISVYTSGDATDTPGSGQTIRASYFNVVQQNQTVSSETATGTSTTMDRTLGGAFNWATTAVSIQPAAAGPEDLTANSGSFSISGTSINLTASRLLAAQTNNFTISGSNADLDKSALLSAQSGTFNISGTNVDLNFNTGVESLIANSGSFNISGSNADLISSRLLAAQTQSYNIAGTNIDLSTTFLLNAQTNAYIFSGSNSALIKNSILSATSAVFTVSGATISLYYSGLLSINSGAYALTGQNIGLIAARLLTAQSGSYNLNGSQITLTYSGAAAFPDIDGAQVSFTSGSKSFSFSAGSKSFSFIN